VTTAAGDAGTIEPPVWYGPLREPSWLVPRVRDDAPRVVFCAESWGDRPVDGPGRDLRLGLPIYLAEATRFGTDAGCFVVRAPVEGSDTIADADAVVRTAVAPDGGASVRVRVFDGSGAVVDEIVREARDERTLGEALAGLPRACTDALTREGVRPIWNSLYTLPGGASLVVYVRGLRACQRITDETLPSTADAQAVAERRDDVRSTLTTLGSLATSTTEAFPALLFFGAVLAAHDVGAPMVGEFRLPVNSRSTTATEPFDPVFAMSALALRIFGDRATSERRLGALQASDSTAVRTWIDVVRTVA
jgi:hypothetical protein